VESKQTQRVRGESIVEVEASLEWKDPRRERMVDLKREVA
jgi:hypothetical protein